MTDEKWLEKWSVVRERGKARQITIIAASGFAFGIAMWLANEAYRLATGGYLTDVWMFTSPYAAIYWAALWALGESVRWWFNERRFRRLEKEKDGSAGRI